VLALVQQHNKPFNAGGCQEARGGGQGARGAALARGGVAPARRGAHDAAARAAPRTRPARPPLRRPRCSRHRRLPRVQGHQEGGRHQGARRARGGGQAHGQGAAAGARGRMRPHGGACMHDAWAGLPAPTELRRCPFPPPHNAGVWQDQDLPAAAGGPASAQQGGAGRAATTRGRGRRAVGARAPGAAARSARAAAFARALCPTRSPAHPCTLVRPMPPCLPTSTGARRQKSGAAGGAGGAGRGAASAAGAGGG
jgi:hypothetical protein